MASAPAPISSMLDAALAYAARGWRVFPLHTPSSRDGVVTGACSCHNVECASIGKHPRNKDGCKGATTDTKQIAEWWRMWPDANIGIATGAELAVLDVDPRHAGDESLARLEATHGTLPSSIEVLTGGGGRHVYFRAGGMRNSAGLLGPGVDTRGEGGYVVAPPSMHESGRRYAWDAGHDPEESELAPLPEWIARAVTAKRAAPAADHARADAFVEGGRNHALASLAGTMRRRGMSEQAILAALLVENEQRCKPPLDEAEVQGVARKIARYDAEDPVKPASGTFLVHGVSDVWKPLAPVPYLVPALRLTSVGGVSMVAGYGFSGKTVAMQDLALAVASGGDVWGTYSAKRGRVVHLDYEQGQRLTYERYQRLARGRWLEPERLEEDDLGVVSFPEFYLDEPEAEEALRRLVEGVALLIVDSFKAAFRGVDENSSDSRQYLDMLSRVGEKSSTAIALIHHAGKPPADGSTRETKYSVRGSGALFDACGRVFVFAGAKDQPTKVHHEKDRVMGTTLDEFGVRIVDVPMGDEPRWGLRVVHADAQELVNKRRVNEKYEQTTARVLEAIRANQGASKNRLRLVVSGSKDLFEAALEDLIERRQVAVEKRDGKGGGDAYRTV